MEFRNVDYGTGFETLSAGVSETTPQSGLRSENVRFRNEGFIEIFKCLAVAASLIRAKVAEPPACHHRRKSMGQFGSRTPSRKPSKTSGRNRGIRRNEGGPLSDHQSAFSPVCILTNPAIGSAVHAILSGPRFSFRGSFGGRSRTVGTGILIFISSFSTSHGER